MRYKHNYLFLFNFLTFCLLILSSCDKQAETAKETAAVPIVAKVKTSVPEHDSHENQISIENKSYLFDVTDHSIEELRTLLARAEEVSQTQSDEFKDLEIVMVLHGPDIEWFKQENYERNQKLIDLAARLDAYDIIDMKVCEATMSSMGVGREEIPSFIESVPYAPTEIKQRKQDGYINL